MMKEMVPPPLPPKSRSNSCSAAAEVSGATVFIRPSPPQVHSSGDNTGNTFPDAGSGGHVVKIKISDEKATQPIPKKSSSVVVNEVSPSATSVVRINVGDANPEEMRSSYFFCNGAISAVMSSGQCSPSDTLDSGTCSDLDGTPPPLPKKKSVTVTVIGAQHKRASSLTSSGADPDSAASDNESNISCDSLNSSDLNLPPSPPNMGALNISSNNSSSALMPQGLLKDIRDRSVKLSQPAADKSAEKTLDVMKEPRSATKFSILINESTYEERQEQKKASLTEKGDESPRIYTYESDKFYKFHLNENFEGNKDEAPVSKPSEEDESFAGYRDYLSTNGSSAIRSAKGTIRGVKNRVRAGIATFLQINSATKSYREKDAGKVVVYSTTMGIVRHTYQQCVKVKQILRTHLVKFEERDVFMSAECQQEIKERMRCDHILIPQVFVDGQHVGDAETVERLNESGELRKILKPYKSADACTTCLACGGYRLLPCPVCNGSKKSVHRNHFTAEFVALKCMNCDEVGLVRCSTCS